jgi:putative membrane-bound dehydrogenase-like protein
MMRPRYPLLGFALLTLAALPLVGLGDAAAPISPADGGGAAAPAGPLAGPRVKVLFLGDDGHHKPLDRYRQVASEMTRRGVDLTYVDELGQVTPENLRRFDALLLYANTEKVTPAAEKAILDYVAEGHGYAVIHCGSYCFLNSKPLTELAGGRFKRHGTGVFKETHVKPEHPILKDLKEVESWDETYVHEMHNEAGREVLSTRDDKDGKEPYTWTRTHGKGRVFYTAWGHDERTWGNKDFQDLLERGVRWAAGDAELAAKTTLPPFEYGEGKAPNYIANKPWGTTGDLITRIQKPADPDVSMKHMVTAAGMDVKLFAADPKIFKPICMAFDERGRLWVAETFDYPNEMQEPGKGRDRISILEDTDGDGVADKFTVFADKLSIPTSLCFANGGVVVTQAPDTLFLKDTDGDDKADVRQVLFTGWGTADTHAGPSNLRWGPDNWVYGIVGYSGFNGEVGGQKVRFTQGIWRMKPDGSKVEFLASLTNNAWGLGFSEEGHLFASTANNDPAFYMAIPNRAYETVRGATVKRLTPIMDSAAIFPATEAVRQVDQHGKYTAAAGSALYTARTWPSYYWNRTSFVTEGTGHVIGQFLLQPKGASFVARNDASALASTDEWTAPIAAEVGPDGQLWFIDWYNFIVQHNPIPKGFEKGKGNAYVSDLRDKRHGRVYRLVYKDGKPSATFKLSKDDVPGLLAALKSDNQLWRMHAQRLLVERGDKAVGPALAKLVAEAPVDGTGLAPAAVHALWTMQGLGLLDAGATAGGNAAPPAEATAAVDAALVHKSAGVRKAAVDVLPRTDAGLAALLSHKLLTDADPQVRKSAFLAVAEMPATAAAAGEAVYAAVAGQAVGDDRFLADAATVAAARHDAAFLKSVLAAYKAPDAPAAGDPAPSASAAKNLLPNPSFEAAAGTGTPRGWRVRHYTGEAKQELSTAVAHTGKNALLLSSEKGADTSWYADVPCEPNTSYALSAWVKLDNVKAIRGGRGVLLNVHGTDVATKGVTGTSDWQKVEVKFKSGPQTRMSINCLFGGYGQATGTAYFDDVELTKSGPAVADLPGATGKVLSAVITHYALRTPTDSVVQTLASLKSAQPKMATVVIDALSAGWPENKASAPTLSDADAAELKAVMAALPPGGRDRLLALVGKWGRADLFGDALAASVKEMTAAVADAALAPAKRAEAAGRLIAVADNSDTVAAIVKQVTDVKSDPAARAALLQSLADSRSPAVGDLMVKAWPKLTPATQSAALPILLRREPWTRSLLAGIKAGDVNPKDVLPQQWQAMTTHPDGAIATQAKSLQKSSGQAVSADRKAIVDKLAPLAEKAGNPANGRVVFEKNCMVCHAMDGKGGKVGPELTGVGARPKGDVLIDVMDPNRSVEGTFRQWIARTDDDVISGRLLSESQTSVEIIDAAGVTHPIQRNQLKSLTASNQSVMPEGFEQLPPADVTDLMEYLAASKVKH